MKQRRVLFCTFEGLREAVALTAIVRDLHRAYPNQFLTDVFTTAPQLWHHNSLLTKLSWEPVPTLFKRERVKATVPHVLADIVSNDPDLEVVVVEASCRDEKTAPAFSSHPHLINRMALEVEKRLGCQIPISSARGDIHLSEAERALSPAVYSIEPGRRFWLMEIGGDPRHSVRWIPPAVPQQVVDCFRGRLLFVQTGLNVDFAPSLSGVINLVGIPDIRDLICLVYLSDGVVASHSPLIDLAAAVPQRPMTSSVDHQRVRPQVIIAGGDREVEYFSYPETTIFSAIGGLTCCADGACGRTQVRQIGEDRDECRSEVACTNPVLDPSRVYYARCRTTPSADIVIDAIRASYPGELFTLAR